MDLQRVWSLANSTINCSNVSKTDSDLINIPALCWLTPVSSVDLSRLKTKVYGNQLQQHFLKAVNELVSLKLT